MTSISGQSVQESATSVGDLEDRLRAVRKRVEDACERAGRRPGDVRIVAVAKTHPPAAVAAARSAGLTDVGENRVQEMLGKMAALDGGTATRRDRSHDRDTEPCLRWHFVGRLQSNKARDVVGRTVLVHAVDRRSLGEELSKRAVAAQTVQRVLVQVNVGHDPAKAGCQPDDTGDLVGYLRGLDNLSVEGLTTIPPLPPEEVDQAEAARPHFAELRDIRDRLRDHWPEVRHLSMGMTADFEVAVEEGATILRLGRALFGPRVPAGGAGRAHPRAEGLP